MRTVSFCPKALYHMIQDEEKGATGGFFHLFRGRHSRWAHFRVPPSDKKSHQKNHADASFECILTSPVGSEFSKSISPNPFGSLFHQGTHAFQIFPIQSAPCPSHIPIPHPLPPGVTEALAVAHHLPLGASQWLSASTSKSTLLRCAQGAESGVTAKLTEAPSGAERNTS